MAENFRYFASEGWESDQEKELKEEVEKNGVLNVKEFCKTRLEQWREVEVTIAITGTQELENPALSTQSEGKYNNII